MTASNHMVVDIREFGAHQREIPSLPIYISYKRKLASFALRQGWGQIHLINYKYKYDDVEFFKYKNKYKALKNIKYKYSLSNTNTIFLKMFSPESTLFNHM